MLRIIFYALISSSFDRLFETNLTNSIHLTLHSSWITRNDLIPNKMCISQQWWKIICAITNYECTFRSENSPSMERRLTCSVFCAYTEQIEYTNKLITSRDRPWIKIFFFFIFHSNNFIIPLDRKRKIFYRARSIQFKVHKLIDKRNYKIKYNNNF